MPIYKVPIDDLDVKVREIEERNETIVSVDIRLREAFIYAAPATQPPMHYRAP